MNTRVCRRCEKSEAEGAVFSPNRIRRCDWHCNKCRRTERRTDPATRLSYKLQSSLHQRGQREEFPGTPFVRQVLEQCGGKSVISGDDDVSRLCVVRVDPGKPWELDNAVLVTSGESSAISRTRTLEQRLRLMQRWKN